MIRFSSIVLSLFLLGASVPASALEKYVQTLDGGATVDVHNASGWPQSEVWALVLAADRSTREECVYDPPDVKGLFKQGDRIFVNQNYIAWFDFTVGDGVTFPAPYQNNWARSGELAGFWTLNPATHAFKYYRTGPNGCFNWPANELIVGSASPNGETHWWDANAPALEHAMNVKRTDGSNQWLFMAFHYAQSTVKSGFARVSDGVVDGGGSVHYKQKAKMTAYNGQTDIRDNNDSTLSPDYINVEIEYICRPTDVISYYTFQPSVTITADNVFIYFWSSYTGLDLDGTDCDAGGAGSQWPHSSLVTNKPMYGMSGTDTLFRNFQGGGMYPPHTIVPIVLGEPCRPVDGPNTDIWLYTPVNGSYIRWGADPNLSPVLPRFQIINLGTPNTGTGVRSDPYRIQMGSMNFSEERRDGTLGGGILKLDPPNTFTFQGGKWYEMMFAFGSSF